MVRKKANAGLPPQDGPPPGSPGEGSSAWSYGRIVQVYMSPDQHYRVEVRDNGQCRIYQSGDLVHTCDTEPEAVRWVIGRGVKQLL